MKVISAFFLLVVPCLGQTSSPRQKFEVASVKRNDSLPSEMSGAMRLTGDTLRIERIRLKDLIQLAYEVKPYQLVGGPKWIESEYYRIEAKAKEPIDRAEVRLMLRPLLAERFKLVIHRETRELPAYALLVSKNGPRMQEATSTATPQAMVRTFRDGQRVLNRLLGQQTFMWQVCDALSGMSVLNGKPAIDRTGLKGRYDFTLDWDPDDAAPATDVNVPQPHGPSLFSAIQDQLGLKLEAQKLPVEVIVIDSAEREPTEN